MKQIDNIPITPEQLAALREIKRRLSETCEIKALVLFGSLARGQADEESDVDLLVVDMESWETGIASVLPIRDEILRDGIQV